MKLLSFRRSGGSANWDIRWEAGVADMAAAPTLRDLVVAEA